MAYVVAAVLAFAIVISGLCSPEAQSPADYLSGGSPGTSSCDIVGDRAATGPTVATRDAGDSGCHGGDLRSRTRYGLALDTAVNPSGIAGGHL